MRPFAPLAAGLFAGAMFLGCGPASPTFDTAPKKVSHPDVDAIVGEWQYAGIEFGPGAPPQLNRNVSGGKYTFTADRVAIRHPREKEDREGAYAIDPTTSPKSIDYTVRGDGRLAGIYELDGDTLKLCLPGNSGGLRPDKLEADPKKFTTVITLKRVKGEPNQDK